MTMTRKYHDVTCWLCSAGIGPCLDPSCNLQHPHDNGVCNPCLEEMEEQEEDA